MRYFFCLLVLVAFHPSESIASQQTPGSAISLPKPDVSHGTSLNSALKHGLRAKQYVHVETGNAAQNIYLQATSLKLGTVFIGAFKDEEVTQLMQLPQDHKPLGLMPVGHLP